MAPDAFKFSVYQLVCKWSVWYKVPTAVDKVMAHHFNLSILWMSDCCVSCFPNGWEVLTSLGSAKSGSLQLLEPVDGGRVHLSLLRCGMTEQRAQLRRSVFHADNGGRVCMKRQMSANMSSICNLWVHNAWCSRVAKTKSVLICVLVVIIS